MKLSLAAPESALPFLSIAFGSQASLAHFVMKLLSAAPASGLPSFPIALLRQLSSAAATPTADPSVTTDTRTAKRVVLMCLSSKAIRTNKSQPEYSRFSQDVATLVFSWSHEPSSLRAFSDWGPWSQAAP